MAKENPASPLLNIIDNTIDKSDPTQKAIYLLAMLVDDKSKTKTP